MVAARSWEPPVTLACPAFLQYNWIDEAEECGYKAVMVRSQADLFLRADVYVMSYHFLVNLDLDVVQANTFVVDEFHYAKNLDAKRTQAVVAEIECIKKVMLLSGTPIPSRPIEIYPILDAIGAYDRGYYSFAHRFCAMRKTKWGLDVSGASNLDQLRELIAPYLIRFTKDQVLKSLPPKTYRVLSQDLVLPPEEKEYDVREFEHVAPEVAFETLSTVMRMHAALKFPVITEIIDHHFATTDEKLIVFGHHREEMLDPLFERYAESHGAVRIIGGMTPKAKKKAEFEFQNSQDCRIIFLGITAGGVGLTLTAAQRVLLAESSWVPGDIDQAADRAHRIGQIGSVQADIVTIRGSIDEYQLRRALEKLEITSQILKRSELPPMEPNEIMEKLAAILADAATQIGALANDAGGTEEEEAPKRTRRGRKAAAESDDGEEEEKPKRTRRTRSKAADDDGEEEEKPKRTRRTRSKAADDDGEEEEKPKRTRRTRSKAADDDGEEEEKPKRTRRTRAKKPADPFDAVRTKASELLKETSREDLNDLLEEFEVSQVSELDPADFDEFIAAADEMIADAGDDE
jgi:hypothetical protein